MDNNRKSFLDALKTQGLQYAMKLMNDPKNQARMIEFFNVIEKGRSQLSDVSKQVLGLCNLPTKQDIGQLNQKLSFIKKQLQEVKRSLDEQEHSNRPREPLN